MKVCTLRNGVRRRQTGVCAGLKSGGGVAAFANIKLTGESLVPVPREFFENYFAARSTAGMESNSALLSGMTKRSPSGLKAL